MFIYINTTKWLRPAQLMVAGWRTRRTVVIAGDAAADNRTDNDTCERRWHDGRRTFGSSKPSMVHKETSSSREWWDGPRTRNTIRTHTSTDCFACGRKPYWWPLFGPRGDLTADDSCHCLNSLSRIIPYEIILLIVKNVIKMFEKQSE